MNNIKLFQLKNIKQCKFKAYISQFNFNTINNKASVIKKVYRSIFQEYDFLNLSNAEIKEVIESKLDDSMFLTKQEKAMEVETMLNYILRYIDYEKKLHRKILDKKIYGKVQIGEKEIELNADIVFENRDSIEIAKFVPGATGLSYKARTDKNLPENDIELYLLKLLGERLYPHSTHNKRVIVSFYHMKGKSEDRDIYKQFLEDNSVLKDKVNDLKSICCADKKQQKVIYKEIKQIEDVLYFNNSEGNNIITFDYSKDLDNEIIDLINTKLSYNSEKCASSECEMCNYSTLCKHQGNDKNKELQEVVQVSKANGEVKLTEAQKEVVSIDEGIYRINAVPGSGKSTTMVMRVIELFRKGYKPEDILMITFTNKGCQELKEKIMYWLRYYKIKGIDFKDLDIYTFNSFGETIVGKEWGRLGFTQKPQLASIIDINDIIKELLNEYDKIEWLDYRNPLMNYPSAKGAFKQLLIYFNAIKSFNYDEKSFVNGVLSKEKDSIDSKYLKSKAKLIFELYDKFNSLLKEQNLLQYQNQILYLIELLEKSPELINTYGYKHLIVDEYQDSNFSQVKLLHLFNTYKELKSFMVVGDSSQSIFGFNDTTPENILNFHKQFPDAKDVFLLENFRSTPQICKVANKLDKLNSQRINKEIISRKEDGEIPKLLSFKTLIDENKYITNLIAEKIENENIPKHEICCIARTKKELLKMQECLNEKGIDSIIEASELYLDNTNVQFILNLANFFRNTEQDYYLAEYMSFIDPEFRKSSIEYSKDIVDSLENRILADFDEISEKENKEELKIQYFYNMISPIVKSDLVVKSFIETIQNKTFYTFNELLRYLYKVVLYKDDASIVKDDKKFDAVVLTTGHSSKGKEWKVVVNTLNSYKYEDIKNDKELLEEERRLVFVSITRAKEQLYITYNKNEDKIKGKGKYCLFADELEDVDRIEVL